MKAAIYCRVSTTNQEDNYSLATQEEACRSHAAENGYTVAGVYVDVRSGAELWERPQLNEVREAARKGEIDAIITYDPDRLSRRQVHFAVLIDEAERFNVQLIFVNGQHDKSAVGEFLANARAFAAELEREKFRERSQRGLIARAKSGKLRPSNRPRYGYRWADDSKSAYVIDEDKAAVVRRIFAAVGAGQTLRTIARQLNDDGIATANGGARWTHVVVRAMLKCEGYAGIAVCNRYADTRVNGKRKRAPRPESEHIVLPNGTIPAIISPDLFAIAQERLLRNKEEATRHNHNPKAFLLRAGFVRCGYCGKPVYAVWDRNRRNAEPAPLYTVQRRSCDHYDCPSFSVKAHILDSAVWEKIAAIVMEPDTIAAELERLRADDPTEADLTGLERALQQVVRKQANIGRSVALIDDADAAAPLIAELKTLAARKRELEKERGAILARQASWRAAQDHLADMQAWITAVAGNLDGLTYQQKRDLLSALDVRVKLYRMDHTPRYEITASLPLEAPVVVAQPR